MRIFFLSFLSICIIQTTYTQSKFISIDSVKIQSERYVNAVNQNVNKLDTRLSEESISFLNRFEKIERMISKKLAGKDSSYNLGLTTTCISEYEELRSMFLTGSGKLENKARYFPMIDSLITSVKFLSEFTKVGTNTFLSENVLLKSLDNIEELREKLLYTEKIQSFIQNREKVLSEKLLSLGLIREFRKYQKEVAYYKMYVKNFHETLNNPERIIASSLHLLQQIPSFQKYFGRFSVLSSMFQLPGNAIDATAATMSGLQTIDGTREIMQQKLGRVNIGASQLTQSQIVGAQTFLQEIKNKLPVNSGQESEIIIPDYKINQERNKSLFERLEFGANFQNLRSNGILPNSTDFGFSLGYKINQSTIWGLGLSYRVGWGEGLNKIKISQQGIGFRTFLDAKLKGSIYISGGGELIYLNEFRRLDILKDYSAWQKSALIGLSKRYTVNKKIKGNIQILYDFLGQTQIPRHQALVFRFGYHF